MRSASDHRPLYDMHELGADVWRHPRGKRTGPLEALRIVRDALVALLCLGELFWAWLRNELHLLAGEWSEALEFLLGLHDELAQGC